MTAVKWLQIKMATSSAEEMVENINVWFAKAKEMEKEQDIYLLRWMAANVIEVQGGWEYDGWTYSDEGILEVYYKQ